MAERLTAVNERLPLWCHRAGPQRGQIGKVLAAIGGTEAILKERFMDLLTYPETETRKLLTTPASSIGTSRFALEPEHYQKMAEVLEKHDIRYVLMNGGNGTMDACGKLQQGLPGKGDFRGRRTEDH